MFNLTFTGFPEKKERKEFFFIQIKSIWYYNAISPGDAQLLLKIGY